MHRESPSLPGFKRLQYAFAAHLRDPDNCPAPTGIEERRIKVYRDLFYNNVESFLANGFPVLRKLHDDAAWHRLVRDFFSRHRSRTPFFHGIAEEFLHYLQDERGSLQQDPPFLYELAHYEWVELALGISEAEINFDGIQENGDLLEGAPVLSPLAWNLTYPFPVHRISPEFRPDKPDEQATHIVVYRSRSDQVAFLEINPVTARLLQLIEAQPGASGRTHLHRIAQDMNHPKPEVVFEGGREMLEGLRSRDIILGTRIS